MKKILVLAAIFIFALTACSDPGDDKVIPETAALLKISNNSSYALYNVWYSSSEFEDIGVGGNKTMNVNPDSLNPVYFALSINNKNIQCYTMDEIMCEKGKIKEFNIINDRVVTAIESQKTDTIKGLYEALSKPIFQLSQDETVIANNDPLPFDFGQAELGANKSFVFTIKNIGNLPLELTGDPVILLSNAVFTVPSQPTVKSINPGSSIAFILQYSPTEEREDTATISIFNNSDDLVFTHNVSGNGYVKRPQIVIKQGGTTIQQNGSFNFTYMRVEIVGEHSDWSFVVSNSGEADLTFFLVNDNSINLEENDDDHFSIVQQPNAATTVTPESTTGFTIRFAPKSEGDFSAIVRISTNSRDNEIFNFTVMGKSYLRKPQIQVRNRTGTNEIVDNHSTLDFNTGAGSYNDLTFTVRNSGSSGDGNLLITNINGNRINLEDNTDGVFSIIQQPSVSFLSPGNDTGFIIRFAPSAIGQISTASVKIITNSYTDDEFSFVLKGTGRELAIGDMGPGGGIIFFIDGSLCKEVNTNDIAYTNWPTAITRAENFTGNLFTDWYLPAVNELQLILNNARGAANMSESIRYWSSMEADIDNAFSVYWDSSTSSAVSVSRQKTLSGWVRAVRSFTR